jgi:HJR/Mrr/RecB family endonuclease
LTNFAGAAFYGAAAAAVVAPNGYTTAAQQLAASLGVKCLHHDECETAFAPPAIAAG